MYANSRAHLLSRILNQHPSELVCRFTTDILAKRAPVLIQDFRILMVEAGELKANWALKTSKLRISLVHPDHVRCGFRLCWLNLAHWPLL
jgi:hypothetical protein